MKLPCLGCFGKKVLGESKVPNIDVQSGDMNSFNSETGDTASTCCDKNPVNGDGGSNNQLKGIRFDNGGKQLDFQIVENENQGDQEEPNILRPGPCHSPNPEEPYQTMRGLGEAPTLAQQEQIIFESFNCGNNENPNKQEAQGNDVQTEPEKPSTGIHAKLPNEVQEGKEPDVNKLDTKLYQLEGIRFSNGDFQVDFLIV